MRSQKDRLIQIGIKDEKTIARFRKKQIFKDNGCIEYKGFKTPKGYCSITLTFNGESSGCRAHRFSYALEYGFDELPPGSDKTQKRKVLHHKCENKGCVNPLHLEVVTDNWNLGRVNDKNMF